MRASAAWILVAVFAMVLSVVSPGVATAVASVPQALGHAEGGPSTLINTNYSYNWAGYAATSAAGSVTQVSGTWVQPTVTCPKPAASYLSTWVGIDGYNNGDLVQTGTSAACIGGTVSYNAWWEVLPAPETVISSITVHAGDTITASVTYSSTTHKFTMSIADGASSFSKTKKVSGTARDSVECIVERPSVGGSIASLAKFTSDKFSSCTATIGGITGAIGTFANVYAIDMVNNHDTKIIGLTSALKSNTAFSVKWKGYS